MAPSALATQAAIHLTDVTADSGLDAVMTSGSLPSQQILEVKGGGLALIDFDNDGDFDLFMPNGASLADPEGGPGARLFENLGGLRFRDVTAASGIAHHRWSYGTATGDVDGDGRDDLFIACFGPDVLLRNLGDGRFEDISERAGIGGAGWSTGAAFGDVDGDGDLDLYVARYVVFDPAKPPSPTIFRSLPVMAGPMGLEAAPDTLWINNGDGTFTDASERSGVHAPDPSYGLNVAILDLTGDGSADILVANDSRANFLFRGRGDGSFEEVGEASGIATNMEGLEQATMGIAIADVDGNGRPDVFTTNFSSDTNTLHLNLDGRFFDDRTQQYGLGAVSRPYLGWACAFADLDLDGDEDLLVFDGHVYPQASREAMDSDYEQPPLLFARDGKRFRKVEATEAGAWLAERHRDRTAVFADLDDDGDVDVVVGELNGPLRILRNDAAGASAGSWLRVRLDDPGTPGNRHGIGATIDCIAGSAEQRRWLWGGGPFQSTTAPEAHFGLPSGTERVDVVVTWPNGQVQRVDGVAAGAPLVVRREAAASP
ncbi:MAG: CRTAC1 family protein [Phycisphaerales bacterium]|nr:CRTAC1 family protein [Phycisphaerales bacterium]